MKFIKENKGGGENKGIVEEKSRKLFFKPPFDNIISLNCRDCLYLFVKNVT